mmetsp:Transcript_10785/g.19498  ORF Transcript_10785/g.19498 Transcript_10785/m.19498 type:complete len:171 (-) Transcript_10785:1772-2284(-)
MIQFGFVLSVGSYRKNGVQKWLTNSSDSVCALNRNRSRLKKSSSVKRLYVFHGNESFEILNLVQEINKQQIQIQPKQIEIQDVFVFMIGSLPFTIATYQFWTRIAKGQRFGTGKDSVIIDTGRKPIDNKESKSTALRTLSKSALNVAYFLTAIALFSYLLVALQFIEVNQ